MRTRTHTPTTLEYCITIGIAAALILPALPAAAQVERPARLPAPADRDISSTPDFRGGPAATSTRPARRASPQGHAAGARRAEFEARAAKVRERLGSQIGNATSTRALVRAGQTKDNVTVSEHTQERILVAIEHIKERLVRAIERITNLTNRIEAHAETLAEERDIDISTAQAFIEDARTELRNASVIVNEDLAAEVAAALEDESPREAFQYVKESIREARTHIRNAHTALKSAVGALRDAVAARPDSRTLASDDTL